MTVTNKETSIIHRVAGTFLRHPDQVNGLLEADAEIINRPGEGYLVVKTDGIHEEIKEGLYADPFQIGWMAVTAPVSDLAAVGATPTGILLSLVLPKSYDDNWLEKFNSGIADACRRYNMYVLGGDTNFDASFSVSASVVGAIDSGKPLLRNGMKPGDYLYATARLGGGNAYAYARYFDKELKIDYQPLARLTESTMIREFATACTDTSDGLFPALAVLSELNGLGFNIEPSLDEILSDDAVAVHGHAGLPAWMLLAGPHGEYELLFTIPEDRHDNFKDFCKIKSWNPVRVGKVREDERCRFVSGSLRVECHPASIGNMFFEAGGDVSLYFDLLMKQHRYWESNS